MKWSPVYWARIWSDCELGEAREFMPHGKCQEDQGHRHEEKIPFVWLFFCSTRNPKPLFSQRSLWRVEHRCRQGQKCTKRKKVVHLNLTSALQTGLLLSLNKSLMVFVWPATENIKRKDTWRKCADAEQSDSTTPVMHSNLWTLSSNSTLGVSVQVASILPLFTDHLVLLKNIILRSCALLKQRSVCESVECLMAFHWCRREKQRSHTTEQVFNGSAAPQVLVFSFGVLLELPWCTVEYCP